MADGSSCKEETTLTDGYGNGADFQLAWCRCEDLLQKLDGQHKQLQQTLQEWLDRLQKARQEQLKLQGRLIMEKDRAQLRWQEHTEKVATKGWSAQCISCNGTTGRVAPVADENTDIDNIMPSVSGHVIPMNPKKMGSQVSLAWQDLNESPKGYHETVEIKTGINVGIKMEKYQKGALWRLVHSVQFEIVCSVVILMNAVFIGIHMDARLKSMMHNDMIHSSLDIIDLIFCMWFVLELLLRIVAERLVFVFGPEWKWNFFDAMLIAVWVMDIIMTSMITGNQRFNVTLARILRFARFLKIFRLTRAIRAFHSLRILVISIFESILSMCWCILVIVIILYIFAIFFLHGVSEHLHDNKDSLEDQALMQLEKFFNSVPRAMISLFMSITGGVNWSELMDVLGSIGWRYEGFFLLYIFYMMFGVLNVIVGAIVATTAEISRKDREAMIKTQLIQLKKDMQRITTCFREADQDKSGMLSWEEFHAHIGDDNVKAYFQALDLDVSHAKDLFQLLDVDGNNRVGLNEFLDGCMRLKGHAKSIDVKMLLYEIRRFIPKLEETMGNSKSTICHFMD